VKSSPPIVRRLQGIFGALAAGIFLAAAPADDGPVVVHRPVVLTTRTPLGEAQVGFPSGTSLEACGSADGWIRVRRGPFSGWVELKDTDRNPVPVETPVPAAVPSSTPAPAPPEAVPGGLPAALENYRALLASVGLDLSAPAAFLVAILAFLAGLATLGWLRARRPVPAPAPAPAPVPASSSGQTIPCPHCGAVLPVDSLRPGRMECASCKGAFVCE
jgi:hypothetical protein